MIRPVAVTNSYPPETAEVFLRRRVVDGRLNVGDFNGGLCAFSQPSQQGSEKVIPSEQPKTGPADARADSRVKRISHAR